MNFAKLDKNNKVINIEKATDEWVMQQKDKHLYIKYNEDNPAIIDGDFVNGFFYGPQPYESWTRDGKGSWIAPKIKPESDKLLFWNEDKLDWEELNV